jgi:bacterioferritin-associated ferredoxin
MYVCHCRAVTLWGIRSAIASGARSVDDITAVCHAGRGCGGCLRLLQAFVDATLASDGSERPATVEQPVGRRGWPMAPTTPADTTSVPDRRT